MYKSGQIIFFRSDLKVNEEYGDIEFISDMCKLRGTLATIEEFDESDNTFTIKEDGAKYWYSKEMLVF
jgi:hypothetical protein